MQPSWFVSWFSRNMSLSHKVVSAIPYRFIWPGLIDTDIRGKQSRVWENYCPNFPSHAIHYSIVDVHADLHCGNAGTLLVEEWQYCQNVTLFKYRLIKLIWVYNLDVCVCIFYLYFDLILKCSYYYLKYWISSSKGT